MKLDAVILAAGAGNRMAELTRGRPKCLLPVGNHNLIWFAITGLRSIGVSRIIILVPDVHEQDIKQYCHKRFNSQKDLILEFVTVSMKADCGTAQSILAISDKIRDDFIVYSCDSIVDPRTLASLLNHYRLYDPMLTMLLVDNNNYFASKAVPGRRDKDRNFRDVIAIEPLEKTDQTSSNDSFSSKLVFLHSERDLVKNLKIKNKELALHPSLEVFSRFLDTHIYIFKRQVLEIFEQNKDSTVLKSELIPLLISKQFSKMDEENAEDDDVEMVRTARRMNYEVELKERLENLNPRNVINSVDYRKPRLPRPSACHAIITKNTTAYRVNTLMNYIDSNREAKNILNLYQVKNFNTVKDCVVGDETTIGEKCTLKGGSIGNNCKLGDKVKLFGCVVMDSVEIESNVSLSECIIGSHSRIGSKCDLKSCIIGFKQIVPSGRKSNSEVIIDDGYTIDLTDTLLDTT